MTFSELRSSVRTLLNEQTQNKYLDTDVDKFLDYGNKLFSVEAEILSSQLTVSWASGTAEKAISTFTRILKPKHVIWKWNTANARRLLPIQYIDLPWAQVPNQGTPTRYYWNNEQLGLWPTPNETADVMVIYAFSCASLSAGTDISQLPHRWHMAPVHYAVSQLAQKFGPPEKVSTAWSIWQKMVKDAQMLDRRPADPNDALQFRVMSSQDPSDYPQTGTYRPLEY